MVLASLLRGVWERDNYQPTCPILLHNWLFIRLRLIFQTISCGDSKAMTPDSGRVSIPSWKLELMKNRRNSRTSASFSHYDRSRRPETLKTPAREDDNAKPRDIINFFNRKTSIDVARVNVCSSRSFRERRGAGDVGTMSCRPGGGMWQWCEPAGEAPDAWCGLSFISLNNWR